MTQKHQRKKNQDGNLFGVSVNALDFVIFSNWLQENLFPNNRSPTWINGSHSESDWQTFAN